MPLDDFVVGTWEFDREVDDVFVDPPKIITSSTLQMTEDGAYKIEFVFDDGEAEQHAGEYLIVQPETVPGGRGVHEEVVALRGGGSVMLKRDGAGLALWEYQGAKFFTYRYVGP